MILAWLLSGTGEARVLETLEAGGGLSYNLELMPCVKRDCPLQVTLVRDGRTVDAVTLPWPATSPEMAEEAVTPWWGAGDPLTGVSEKAWASGDEEHQVSTLLRKASFGQNAIGVIVDQRAGFEHVKRVHLALLGSESKLRRLWQSDEGAEDQFTTVAVRAGRLLFLRISTAGADVQASELKYDSSGQILKAVPATGLLFQIKAASFVNSSRAYAALQQKSACLENFFVIKRHGKYTLSSFSFDPEAAAQLQIKSKGCSGGQTTVTPFR